MCGRFALFGHLSWLFNMFELTGPPCFAPRYNIAPTQPLLTLVYDVDRNTCASDFLVWGFMPAFVKEPDKSMNPIINARAEGLKFRPAFKNSFRYRRCIIPASGFYEWPSCNEERFPHYFSRSDSRHLCFAGIWEIWHGPGGEQVNSCAIITVEANEIVRKVHKRMPVILQDSFLHAWLNPETPVQDLQMMLRPYSAAAMSGVRVSRTVNSVRNDSIACIEPYGIRQPGLFDNLP